MLSYCQKIYFYKFLKGKKLNEILSDKKYQSLLTKDKDKIFSKELVLNLLIFKKRIPQWLTRTCDLKSS